MFGVLFWGFCVLGFEVLELGSVFVVFEFGFSIFGNKTNVETKQWHSNLTTNMCLIHLSEFTVANINGSEK